MESNHGLLINLVMLTMRDTPSSTPLGNNSLELRGGSGPHEGNVYLNGSPICEDDSNNVNQWRSEEAAVVCRCCTVLGVGSELRRFLRIRSKW